MNEEELIDDGFTTCTVKQLKVFLEKCKQYTRESGEEDQEAIEALKFIKDENLADEEVIDVEYSDWCGFLIHKKESQQWASTRQSMS